MNDIINEKSAATENWKDVAKDTLISLIPIYGIYTEFKKGNIGCGIFSAVADIAMLVPVLGSGLKVISAAIRGEKAAIRAGRFADTSLTIAHNPIYKPTTEAITAVHKFTATEKIKIMPELGKDIADTVASRAELASSGGKILVKAGEDITVLWKDFDIMNTG